MLEPAIVINSIKKIIKLQLFQIDNKDKSKHSKNSKYKQIFMKECLRRLNVKAALNACAKKAVSIRQEAAWQLHSRMRQACSSRLHARNCFHGPPYHAINQSINL